jgi:hypothetical protein
MIFDERSKEIHSVHLKEKPICWSKESKKSRFTVSNALAMSTLRRMHEVFRTCSNLAEDWTTLKLSWIARPLMNAHLLI